MSETIQETVAEERREVPLRHRHGRMDNPPKVFVAGSDALAMIVPAVEARLRDTQGYEELSKSTDGLF